MTFQTRWRTADLTFSSELGRSLRLEPAKRWSAASCLPGAHSCPRAPACERPSVIKNERTIQFSRTEASVPLSRSGLRWGRELYSRGPLRQLFSLTHPLFISPLLSGAVNGWGGEAQLETEAAVAAFTLPGHPAPLPSDCSVPREVGRMLPRGVDSVKRFSEIFLAMSRVQVNTAQAMPELPRRGAACLSTCERTVGHGRVSSGVRVVGTTPRPRENRVLHSLSPARALGSALCSARPSSPHRGHQRQGRGT
jgi:hypothetical protein